jgi:nucleoside-diphosphate-sugar epimerase
VVNNLCGLAHVTGKIQMTSDGSPWRPLVHGLDIAKAILAALGASRESIHGEIFNVGDNAQNYRVREVAEMVGEVFTGCEVRFGEQGADNRSYRVNFDKLHKHLPGFKCDWDVARGVRQLHALFRRIDMTEDRFNFRAFTRLRQLQYLIRTGQIDTDFFWRTDI